MRLHITEVLNFPGFLKLYSTNNELNITYFLMDVLFQQTIAVFLCEV